MTNKDSTTNVDETKNNENEPSHNNKNNCWKKNRILKEYLKYCTTTTTNKKKKNDTSSKHDQRQSVFLHFESLLQLSSSFEDNNSLSPNKRKHEDAYPLNQIPTIQYDSFSSIHNTILSDLYSIHSVLHLSPKKKRENKSQNFLTWKDFYTLFQSLTPSDQESWCIETATSTTTETKKKEEESKCYTPEKFLSEKEEQQRGYCSFLLHDTKDEEEVASSWVSTISKLIVPKIGNNWYHTSCIWFFFGRNPPTSSVDALKGRKEHTDSVSHDGTWHYQLSGNKRWFLRPTDELQQQWKETNNNIIPYSNNNIFEVFCEEDDIIILNTRLWFHSTEIPIQTTPSVSYARDFYVSSQNEETTNYTKMSNVDGLYATEDIPEGTVIFREEDAPDCELHRSKTNPNCEIVEVTNEEDDDDEEGKQAVVSIRDIRMGEFFCIAESDDDDEEDDDDDITIEYDEEEESYDDD